MDREPRTNGIGWNAYNLRNLANPTPVIQPKILLRKCQYLNRQLETDLRVFHIVRGGFSAVIEPARRRGFRPVGSEADAFAMIEMFGVDYPEAWLLPEPVAEEFAFLALSALMPTAMAPYRRLRDIPAETWANIIEIIDGNICSSQVHVLFLGLLATTIYSICRMGCYSQKTAADLAADLTALRGVNITISQAGTTGYWMSLRKLYSSGSISLLLEQLLPNFTGSIRLANLVKFSKTKGLSMYYQVKTALGSFPDFNWPYVMSCAKKDFENYIEARQLVRDQDYYGYNPDIGIAAATNYPILSYVAFKLNSVVGGQSSLTSLSSRVLSMVNRDRWDKMVREYRNKVDFRTFTEEQQAVAHEEQQALAHEEYLRIRDHLLRPLGDDDDDVPEDRRPGLPPGGNRRRPRGGDDDGNGGHHPGGLRPIKSPRREEPSTSKLIPDPSRRAFRPSYTIQEEPRVFPEELLPPDMADIDQEVEEYTNLYPTLT